MVEKVLPNVTPVRPQETGFWCGPASARIVLAARGVHVPEAELAREIGTHTGGTDHIGLITDRSLRHRLPQAGYAGVPLHQDPPTGPQRDQLWSDLTRSIDAGYGLVVNWVSPANNRPQPVKGSQRLNYPPGGTIFHYVTYLGYCTDANRAVFVGDPGFSPFSGWISFNQACTLVPPKAYAWPATAAAAIAPPVAPPAPTGALDTLIAAMAPSQVGRDRMGELLPYFSECLTRAQCGTVERIAMLAAQVGHESAGLFYMREIHDGSNYEGRQDLGNTQPGDGVRFRGRGPLQITGRSNYHALSKWAAAQGYIDDPDLFIKQPELLETPRFGFLGTSWYWVVARPNLNVQADRRDIEAATRSINGGLNGLADRRSRWERCLAMGDRLLTLLEAAPAPAPEEGFLMALSDDEQREMLGLLRILADDRTASISPLRHLGSEQHGAVTMPRRVDFLDANLHAVFTMLLASIGDPGHLDLLAEVASAAGDPRYPDRQADAALAGRMLAWAQQSPGVEVPEIVVPPPFVCGVTGTSMCRGGGEGTCSITVSGECIRVYER